MRNVQARMPGRGAIAAPAALLILAAALIALVSPGPATAAKPRPPAPITVLGASSQTANAACPGDPCQAIGKVAGFQTAIARSANPFASPYDGRIVAWSLKLGAPTVKQSEFFTDFYGGQPKARIVILKPRKGKKKKAYTVRSSSPVENLSGLFGTTTTFALQRPLAIRRGQIAALSVPTWAPAFAIGLPKGNTWLASRKPGKCNSEPDIKGGSGHDRPGQRRTYGCTYTTARLLYSATVVRAPLPRKPKAPTKPKK
jgi:hypothetical protein